MKRGYSSIFVVIFTVLILLLMRFSLMPDSSKNEAPLAEFSEKRALQHIKSIADQPHYVGSPNHKIVGNYLEKELQKLGLQTSIQEGYTLTDWGNLVKSRNILARIKGQRSGKALLLLSHYDSAPHSASHGAADNATGVATILEGVRAFLHNKSTHQNDIIILFSDAEELGLNGAELFVTQNQWAKEVGLVLNFEARGTAGPSYMLLEVNDGNAAVIEAFAEAKVSHPVSNSLMYSIYKMLPNDTDLTVFREKGKVQGLNFAFIDDHFNYHTQQDDIAHLDRKSVAHQGSYLMPLLSHFSNADLNLNTNADRNYFNIPFYFVHYPFSWNFTLLLIACVLFLALVFIGLGKRLLNGRDIGKGFLKMFGALLTASAIAYFGWKILLIMYPQYADIQHGFTYNGHSYIAAFILLAIATSFLFYTRTETEIQVANNTIAPVFLWLVLNTLIAIYLPGAGFLIIPIFFTLLMLGFFIITQHSVPILNVLFSIPVIFILAPFIYMLPIGLGLKILAASAGLTVLLFTLLLPVYGRFAGKVYWSFGFLLCSLGFFIYANVNSDYTTGKARPNSLVYVYDAEADKAIWATYDKKLDAWTKTFLTDNPNNASSLNNYALFSKYGSAFTFTSEALVRNVKEPTITFTRDTIIGKQRYLNIKIQSNRDVNRYDIFADEHVAIHNFTANGAKLATQKGSQYKRNGRKILSYYSVDNSPLELRFSIDATKVLDMELFESSFDLMTNPLFNMERRSTTMMPMPFVLTDAVVLVKDIRPTQNQTPKFTSQNNFSLPTGESDTIPDLESDIKIE